MLIGATEIFLSILTTQFTNASCESLHCKRYWMRKRFVCIKCYELKIYPFRTILYCYGKLSLQRLSALSNQDAADWRYNAYYLEIWTAYQGIKRIRSNSSIITSKHNFESYHSLIAVDIRCNIVFSSKDYWTWGKRMQFDCVRNIWVRIKLAEGISSNEWLLNHQHICSFVNTLNGSIYQLTL